VLENGKQHIHNVISVSCRNHLELDSRRLNVIRLIQYRRKFIAEVLIKAKL